MAISAISVKVLLKGTSKKGYHMWLIKRWDLLILSAGGSIKIALGIEGAMNYNYHILSLPKWGSAGSFCDGIVGPFYSQGDFYASTSTQDQGSSVAAAQDLSVNACDIRRAMESRLQLGAVVSWL